MDKKKKVKIIKKNLNNENYTFVIDNVINLNNNENNYSENKKTVAVDERIEKKKIHSKKVDNKGRKILGKSLQGHSPVYE
ncbi:MAG: hypothetical protein AB7F53_08090 [Nitrososphaeraceae archaeon]